MAMIFTLVSAAQEKITTMVEEYIEANKQEKLDKENEKLAEEQV